MNYKSVNEIKSISRDKLLGKYGTAIGAILFIKIFGIVALMITSSVANAGSIMYLLILAVFALIEGVFAFGEQTIYMKISTGNNAAVSDMFSVFKGKADEAIAVRLYFVLVVVGLTVVGELGFGFIYRLGANMLLPALAWLILVAMIFVAFYLNYALVLPLAHDFPDMKTIEVFKKSRSLMRGRKKSLLGALAGFLPLAVLGIISFDIGSLFVHAYFKMTITEFYFDRMGVGQSRVDIEV